MSSSQNHIPYSLDIAIDASDSYQTNINDIFKLIRTPAFSDYNYIITHISIPNPELRKQFFSNPTVPIFLDDYYESTASILKSQFIAKLHYSDLKSISLNQNLLIQDLNYCNHISTKAILLKYPESFSSSDDFQFTSIISSFLQLNPDRCMIIEVDYSKQGLLTWQKIYSQLDYTNSLCLALNIKEDLPECEDNTNSILSQFCASLIAFAVIPISLFLTNKNGFPVLSKAHQEIIKKLFLYKTNIIFRDDMNILKDRHDLYEFTNYKIYINHLFQNHKQFKKIDYAQNAYYDVLQIPLQPLKDNLQSQTYETFEDDQTKYIQYQKAIKSAMKDLFQNKPNRVLLIGVFGGGRGPLVRKALEAWNEIKKKENKLNEDQIKVFCVEKNLYVFNTLLSLKANEKDTFGMVDMIYGDMQTFKPLYGNTIDICISELLGSFGDNELSPECLLNIQTNMSSDGIMIPQKYTSYIRPVYCPKIWFNIKAIKESYYSPYVILFHRAHFPIETTEKCFEFSHPINDTASLNQSVSIQFAFKTSCELHGFAGYFSAILYKDILLSIEPNTYTQDLFSWFPIYFPSNIPIYMNNGEKLIINIKRVNNEKKVWYEWNFDKGNGSLTEKQIHNSNGERYSMLL